LIRLVRPLPGLPPDLIWLRSFDVHARDGLGDIVFTADPREALVFPDFEAVELAWRSRPSPGLPATLSRFHLGAQEIGGELAERLGR
jgi:hypothetical protein